MEGQCKRTPRPYKSMYRGIQRHQPCMANGAVGTGSERRYVLSRRSLIQSSRRGQQQGGCEALPFAASRARMGGQDRVDRGLDGTSMDGWASHPIPSQWGQLRCRCARDRPSRRDMIWEVGNKGQNTLGERECPQTLQQGDRRPHALPGACVRAYIGKTGARGEGRKKQEGKTARISTAERLVRQSTRLRGQAAAQGPNKNNKESPESALPSVVNFVGGNSHTYCTIQYKLNPESGRWVGTQYMVLALDGGSFVSPK